MSFFRSLDQEDISPPPLPSITLISQMIGVLQDNSILNTYSCMCYAYEIDLQGSRLEFLFSRGQLE